MHFQPLNSVHDLEYLCHAVLASRRMRLVPKAPDPKRRFDASLKIIEFKFYPTFSSTKMHFNKLKKHENCQPIQTPNTPPLMSC